MNRCVLAALVAFMAVSSAFAQDRLIAIDSSRAFYEIDMNTGAKTLIGTASSNAGTTGGLAYDAANNTCRVRIRQPTSFSSSTAPPARLRSLAR